MKHIELFEQFANEANTNGMPPSIKNLYSDRDAMRIKKALTFGITPRDNSPANAILISALESNEPQDRADSIKNIINVLNQYLNDDIYISAAKVDK
jgi:hypothetical protein